MRPPAVVASWSPGSSSVVEHVPPPLADVHAFVRRCESAASDLDGTLCTSLLELGNSMWSTAARGWLPGSSPAYGALPEACDPNIWQVAVTFNLPPAPTANGDFWQALEWVMEHAPSQRLAHDAQRYFGDPGSAGAFVIDTSKLPAQPRAVLVDRVTPADATTSLRAQRVLDTLDTHPRAASGTTLGTWPAVNGPRWCATSLDAQLTALHVPRVMPAPGPETGNPLEAVLVRPEPADDYETPSAIGFVITDSDHVMLLPGQGDAADLAATIEHTVWHPGVPTHLVGLPASRNEPLVAAVEALVETGPRTTPWEQLTSLVGKHLDRSYCPYCPKPNDDALEPAEHSAP